jgi:hypothetical protein
MPLPVFAVEVLLQTKKLSFRYVRAESAEQAAARAASWEVPVIEVLPKPLSTEEARQIGQQSARSDLL